MNMRTFYKLTEPQPERIRKFQGYFWIWMPTHRRANNGYVKRAVLNLEEKLGRPLGRYEMSHHLDGDRMNDDPSNLEITTREEHMSIHKPVNKRWHK